MLKVLRLIFNVINAVVIFGLIAIHFVIKEQTFQSSLYYYTFPLPLIIVIILVLSIFLKRNFRKFNLLLASIFLLVWVSRSFKINFAGEIDETDLEIVYWNVAYQRQFQAVFEVGEAIPDVAVLVEYKGGYLEELRKTYPNYYFYTNDALEIGLFSKRQIEILEEIPSKYGSSVISFKTYGLNFYAVDVSGSMDVPRSWELGFVNDVVKVNKNTIVLGDFNVPYESKFLDSLKKDFNHAFNKKGNGFRETWFWNIPLLSLDHIWVSKDLDILKTEKISTFKSDHSMLRMTLNRP